MRLIFVIGIAWLVYVYVGYPVLIALLSFFRRIRPIINETLLPTVSVLIAARNERLDIGWKIAETLGWDYPPDKIEVLVASDASSDGTDEIVQAIHDPRLTLIRLEKRHGKAAALNVLAPLAKGDIMFFTDANSHIAPDCLRRMVRHFADKRVGIVTGEMEHIKEAATAAIGAGEHVYWTYESRIKYLENLVGSVLVCVGSIFCMRRSLFSPLDPDLANDLELPMKIADAGYWILYEPLARSIERTAQSPFEEFSRRRRICAQGMIGAWRLRATLRGLRGWQFASRKFLRWLTLVPFLLVMTAGIGMVNNPLFASILGIQTIFCVLAAVGWRLAMTGRSSGRMISVPFHIMLVGTAGLIGLAEACFGRRFTVWDIASSSRSGMDAEQIPRSTL